MAVKNQNISVVNTANTKNIPAVNVSGKYNVLNDYKTYNYLFTLSGVDTATLKEQDSKRKRSMLEDCSKKFTILKSTGKGQSKISAPNNLGDSPSADNQASNQKIVESFNQRSSGRYDFFINNVDIETLMAFDSKTGTSQATKIRFEVYEPYSISGFIETLQVAAIASGHEQYKTASFLLKVEFKGYPDSNQVSENSQVIDKSTRYFVFTFTGMNIDITEAGTRYICNGVPFNDMGSSDVVCKLKGDVKATGNLVSDVLKDLIDRVNRNNYIDAEKIQGLENSGPGKQDEYEIIFSDVNQNGIDLLSTTNKIAESVWKVINKDNVIFKMIDPADKENTDPKAVQNKPAAQFSRGISLQDCISAVNRDSDYVTNILSNLPKEIDQYGMIPYFQILNEVIPTDKWNEVTKTPIRKYIYRIIPFKIHHTRIPGYENNTVDTSNLIKLVQREYNYIYTGQNVDILSFNLKFDNLYFQAIPQGMGTTPLFSSADNISPENTSNPRISDLVSKDRAQKNSLGQAAVLVSPTENIEVQASTGNSSPTQTDPYSRLVKNLHQAVLDNTSMISAELEIIGDPIYLVQGGISHFYSTTDKNNPGVTIDGDVPYQTGDVMIVVNFRNPTDLDRKTGFMTFNNELVPFSGVFKILSVANSFNDGVFKQKLKIIRIPGQVVDTKQKPAAEVSAMIETPNVNDSTSPVTPPNSNSQLTSVSAGTDPKLTNDAPAASTSNLPNLSKLITRQFGSLASKDSPLVNLLKGKA